MAKVRFTPDGYGKPIITEMDEDRSTIDKCCVRYKKGGASLTEWLYRWDCEVIEDDKV